MNDLCGLILAGGTSKRMGRDKSILSYHGTPQLLFAAELLHHFFPKVFISCRKNQKFDFPIQFPLIYDHYENAGPLGGILTAMEKHPGVDWLVLACDMPLVDKEVIKELLKSRNLSKKGTVFKNNDTGKYEPLIAIYEKKSFGEFKAAFLENKCSLQKNINPDEFEIIERSETEIFKNINTPSDFEGFKKS